VKHQNQHSFVTDDQAVQMGADMAIQFMLMTLFQVVSEMADDPRGLRSDAHEELSELSQPTDCRRSRRMPHGR
jgi:hypothetical protein